MSRILYIGPVNMSGRIYERGIEDHARPGNEITSVSFTRGSRHLEYHYYEALTVPDIVHTVLEAERQGYDAAVIGCFYDLALHECREMATRIVVTAPCESSLLTVASLCESFSVIVGRRKWIPQMRRNVQAYGFGERMASMPAVDLGVLDFHADEQVTAARFFEVGRKAIDEDGAEALILGCTASGSFFADLQRALGVPVIDPSIAAVKHAEHLVELRDRYGWNVSKIGGYEAPPHDELAAWNLPKQYDLADITGFWNLSTAAAH
jgi:allantoin racemase